MPGRAAVPIARTVAPSLRASDAPKCTLPTAARRILDYFYAHPGARFVYGDATYIDERGLWAAFGAMLVAPVVRVLALPHVPHLAIMEWFPTTFDALATGCILALLRERSGIDRRLSSLTGHWLVYLLAAPIIAINSLQWHV